jgi:cyclopropane fatty-acyl-phospholipid synthase-like methyltransferase
MKHDIKGKRASSNDNLVEHLKNNIVPGSSLLDLGCGPKLYSDALREICRPVLTVDAWSWVEPDIVADLETTSLSDITDQRWDYVLMLDFIEHLGKDAGLDLIDQVKKITNRGIFLLTPMEEIWTDNSEHVEDPRLWSHGNSFDLHKSMWYPEDFLGWQRIQLPKLQNYFVGYYAA